MLFTGRLTADAAVRDVGGNKKVTGFTVAINDSFTSKGEKKEITTFIECSYWVNPGLAGYLSKGAVVEIFGRIEAKAWLNNENKPQPYLTCTVNDIRLFGISQKTEVKNEGNVNGEKPEKATVKAAGTGNESSEDDDLPF
jgi:single-strand DNA-binding protein